MTLNIPPVYPTARRQRSEGNDVTTRYPFSTTAALSCGNRHENTAKLKSFHSFFHLNQLTLIIYLIKAPIKNIFVLQNSRDQKATLYQTVSQSVYKWLEATQFLIIIYYPQPESNQLLYLLFIDPVSFISYFVDTYCH